MKPVDYKQTDPRWAKNDYSAPGEATTIAKSGCGPTCMAMVIASLKDPKITPADTAAWSLKKGYKACKQGTYYTYFTPQGAAFGIDVTRVNMANLQTLSSRKAYHDTALQAIKDGHMVICCMGPGHWTKAGHYILWHEMDGMNVVIADPASIAANRMKAPLTKLQAEVKYYFIVRVPKKDSSLLYVKVLANGKAFEGLLREGASYVPVRSVAEAFGAIVSWNEKGKYVTVNGNMVTITNIDGVAYMPARKLAEILNVRIEWDAAKATVLFKKG